MVESAHFLMFGPVGVFGLSMLPGGGGEVRGVIVLLIETPFV